MIEAEIRAAGLGRCAGGGRARRMFRVNNRAGAGGICGIRLCLALPWSTRQAVAAAGEREEDEEPVAFHPDSETGKYIIVFDPLDGSSNIDVNVNVGTIFGILRRMPSELGTLEESILQPGFRQVAAGYVVYGPSTVLVYTTGNGVHGFTLDPKIGAFVLSNERMQIPEQGIYYSVEKRGKCSQLAGGISAVPNDAA